MNYNSIRHSFNLDSYCFRYQFSQVKGVSKAEAEKMGLNKAKDVTLENTYEEIQQLDIDNWENKRGPRPWEPNTQEQKKWWKYLPIAEISIVDLWRQMLRLEHDQHLLTWPCLDTFSIIVHKCEGHSEIKFRNKVFVALFHSLVNKDKQHWLTWNCILTWIKAMVCDILAKIVIYQTKLSVSRHKNKCLGKHCVVIRWVT